jgi:CubicO group peptidase (beta-lactamase class C family)
MALAFLRVLLPTPASEPAFQRAMRAQYLKAFFTNGGTAADLLRFARPAEQPSRSSSPSPSPNMASRTASTADLTELDTFFARVAADIPRGLEVLIAQDGQEIYWKQFGGWRRNPQAPIASATKWYSAGVIMSLVDDGLLSLDDRASKYLPYLTGDKATITIRQLMSHTAGCPGEFPVANRCLGDPADTLDHCARALSNAPLRAKPGSAFIYSGAGMQIAGRVAEVATGKDWQTLFCERIAVPLGLTATDYAYEGATRNPRISGGGRSTVGDYMKYLSMIAQGGVCNGRRVLSSQAVDTMLRDQTGGAPIVESPAERPGIREPRAAPSRYGIGNWLEEPDESGHASWHSSPGLFGWTPVIDTRRHLQVVVGVQAVGKFRTHYTEMKQLLRRLFPDETALDTPERERRTK